MRHWRGALLRLVFISAFAVGACGVAPRAAVLSAEEASAVAQSELRAVTGATCFESTSIEFAAFLVYPKVDALSSGHQWLNPTLKLVYAGPLDEAVASLNGELAARAEGQAWVLTSASGVPEMLQLYSGTSHGGRVVWFVSSREKPSMCS